MSFYRDIDIDPADANLLGFASNVTGDTWVLTATNSGDALAHRVSIRNDAATDHSGKTAILTGTDADGRAQTETVALPAGTLTIESTKYFLTLNTVVPSVTIAADTMDIGWVDEIATKTYQLDPELSAPIFNMTETGVADWTVEISNVNYGKAFNGELNAPFAFADQNDIVWVDSGIANITASAMTALSLWPVSVFRVILNSYTDTAEVKISVQG
jgi:hypothetical protein